MIQWDVKGGADALEHIRLSARLLGYITAQVVLADYRNELSNVRELAHQLDE